MNFSQVLTVDRQEYEFKFTAYTSGFHTLYRIEGMGIPGFMAYDDHLLCLKFIGLTSEAMMQLEARFSDLIESNNA